MLRVARWVTLRVALWGVHEPLVAHVAFAAAEENVGTLLPLHTLVAAEGAKEGNQKHKLQTTTPRHIYLFFQWAYNLKELRRYAKSMNTNTLSFHSFTVEDNETKHLLNNSYVCQYGHKQTQEHKQRNKQTHNLNLSLSISLSVSHQIKTRGSGSRPRLALRSPGRPGGAV